MPLPLHRPDRRPRAHQQAGDHRAGQQPEGGEPGAAGDHPGEHLDASSQPPGERRGAVRADQGGRDGPGVGQPPRALAARHQQGRGDGVRLRPGRRDRGRADQVGGGAAPACAGRSAWCTVRPARVQRRRSTPEVARAPRASVEHEVAAGAWRARPATGPRLRGAAHHDVAPRVDQAGTGGGHDGAGPVGRVALGDGAQVDVDARARAPPTRRGGRAPPRRRPARRGAGGRGSSRDGARSRGRSRRRRTARPTVGSKRPPVRRRRSERGPQHAQQVGPDAPAAARG